MCVRRYAKPLRITQATRVPLYIGYENGATQIAKSVVTPNQILWFTIV